MFYDSSRINVTQEQGRVITAALRLPPPIALIAAKRPPATAHPPASVWAPAQRVEKMVNLDQFCR
jgi:hypothetical protein